MSVHPIQRLLSHDEDVWELLLYSVCNAELCLVQFL